MLHFTCVVLLLIFSAIVSSQQPSPVPIDFEGGASVTVVLELAPFSSAQYNQIGVQEALLAAFSSFFSPPPSITINYNNDLLTFEMLFEDTDLQNSRADLFSVVNFDPLVPLLNDRTIGLSPTNPINITTILSSQLHLVTVQGTPSPTPTVLSIDGGGNDPDPIYTQEWFWGLVVALVTIISLSVSAWAKIKLSRDKHNQRREEREAKKKENANLRRPSNTNNLFGPPAPTLSLPNFPQQAQQQQRQHQPTAQPMFLFPQTPKTPPVRAWPVGQ